jgi:DNA-binding transcriptional regulator YdaS (Cro superfamily)
MMTERYFNPWKNEPKADIKRLAKRLDMHPVYISAVLHGRNKPSKKLGRNIEKKTKGIVTYDALVENFLAQSRKAK